MNIAKNLPEQPTNNSQSKIKESLSGNLDFIKGILYLTKKIFML